MAKAKEDLESDFFIQDADEIERALDEIPRQNSTIRVFRMQAQGNLIFVKSFFPDEFSLDMLQQNHGGGKYKIVPRVNGVTMPGHRIELEGNPILPQKPEIVRDAGGKWLTKEQRAQAEAEALLQTGSRNIDPVVLMILQEMRDMKASLQNANSGSSRLEMFKELAMMKEIFAPAVNQTAVDSQSIVSLIMKGLEIGKDAANGDLPAKSSIWESVLEKALPVVTQAITAASNRAPAPQPNQPIQPTPTTPLPRQGIADILPTVGSEAERKTASLHPFVQQLEPYIGLMMRDAAGNSDPDIWSELIASRIPEAQYDDVIGWLNGPTWRNDLVQLNPNISLQAAWFEGLHDGIISYITEPSDDEGVNDNGAIRQ